MNIDLNKPVDLGSPEFINNKYAWYERIREERPVHTAKISIMKLQTVARYEDCTAIMKDPRVFRNRANATGGSKNPLPFPLPRSVRVLMESMIQEDDPRHKRLREFVRRAFLPQAIKKIEENIASYTHELLDDLEKRKTFDLQQDFALPIPVRMISMMLGVEESQMPHFQNALRVLSEGFSGMQMLKTLTLDLPKTVKFTQQLVNQKRDNPGDDILTALIQVEDEGDRMSDDELVAMVFLLVIAGYETTVHLITNAVHTLVTHPDQLVLLKADPSLADSAVEEVLRYRGPIHGSKPGFAKEDIELDGGILKKGKPIMPLFGAANHDPRVFDEPEKFDIQRESNRHLGFGHGVHFCLGAHLARAEARIALNGLFERFPDLRLQDADALSFQAIPGWHRYNGLPVTVS